MDVIALIFFIVGLRLCPPEVLGPDVSKGGLQLWVGAVPDRGATESVRKGSQPCQGPSTSATFPWNGLVHHCALELGSDTRIRED